MNKLFTATALVCALTFGFTSCDKDNETPTEQEYQAKVMVKNGETKDLVTVSTTANTSGTIQRNGEVYSLRNFRQFTLDTDGKPTTTVSTAFYFDFKENDAVAETESPITFVAQAQAMGLKPNTEKGYSLAYIDKAFNQVVTTDQFINIAEIGIAFSPTAIGWASYDMTDHTVKPVSGRTIILLKNEKPTFKIHLRSIYSDETPNKEKGPDNYIFYSVDYQEFK